jgi:hypothetical protein
MNVSKRLLLTGTKLKTQASESRIAHRLRSLKRCLSLALSKKVVERAAFGVVSRRETIRPNTSGVGNAKIWQIWLQGLSNAPKIVRHLHFKNQMTMPEADLQLLDFDDAVQMAEADSRICDLYRRGRIHPAGFTDYLRFAILAKHGGTWLDSTVVVREPEWLARYQNILLRYKNKSQSFERGSGCDFYATTWIIKASEGSVFCSTIAESLESYWLHYRRQVDYFDAFLHMSLASRQGPKLTLEFLNGPNLKPIDAEVLHKYLRDVSAVDAKAVELFANSPVHKLSYKGVIDPASYIENFEKLWIQSRHH